MLGFRDGQNPKIEIEVIPIRFIISVERGKVASGGDLCQLVRLACGLKYPVGRFFDELTDLNEDLAVGAR